MFHLVEAMLNRIGIGLVTQMPLAREVGRVAVFLEEFGDRRRLLPEAVFVSRGNHDRERRTDRDTPGHERGAAGGATCLAVPAGEDGSLLGYAVDIRCRMTETGASARIATEIIPSGVVGHKHDDIGSFIRGPCRADYR